MSKNKRGSHGSLIRIVQHSMRISKYLAETKREEFLKRAQDYDAIHKQIDLLGEQVAQLQKDDPDNVMAKFSNIPWAEMKAIRNRSSHDYFSINPEIIWQYVTEELPGIETNIRQILRQRYRVDKIEDYAED